MSEEHDFPETGEIAVVKIVNVLDYGAFAELLEYDDLKGFVHISQVSSGWVKNIRNFVKEGQIRAAKVQSVDRSKMQIDLSLTKVSSSAQRAKINEYKQLKRERKLIETLAKREKKSFDDAWDEVAEPLIKKYGSLVEAFKQVLINSKEATEGIPAHWHKPLLEMVDKSVTMPEKTKKGTLKIMVLLEDGVEVVKQGLLKAESAEKTAEIELAYIGSGKYQLKATAHDFKIAEKAINAAAERVVKFVESKGGEASFKMEE